LFRTPGFAKEAERWSYGITSDQWSLRSQHFKMIYSCVPPLDEQELIVGFLRNFDRKVRRFICNRRRLIEVLNEQKQSIINQAVTRGLDSDAPLKPSGIDWIGNVPAYWNPVRLGLFIDLLTGFPFKSNGFTEDVSDIRLLRGINVSPGRVRWDSTVRWSLTALVELSAFTLKEGDIVFGMDRPLVSNGIRVAMIKSQDVPSLLLQRVARIRSRDELDQLYLLLLLQDRRYADYLASIFTGISVPHISPTQISDYRVALPPIEEQRAIVEKVEKETRAVEVMKERAELEIRSIREYRTRLICDVVTGKIDVRHLAPTDSLPADEQIDDVIDVAVMINDDELSIAADDGEND
jgi:type I restriction enzyme S subunit